MFVIGMMSEEETFLISALDFNHILALPRFLAIICFVCFLIVAA